MIRFLSSLLLVGGLSVTVFVQAAQSQDSKTATSWTDKIKLSGDFRYRYEFIGQEYYNGTMTVRGFDRNRNRIRLRLGLQAMINSDVALKVRIATSSANSNANNTISGDPVSTNQDLSGGFTPKPIWLDQAYAEYHPARMKWLGARAGRQPIPFESAGELVWDGDLNLEGVTALLSHKMDKNELFLRAGGYWAGEKAATATHHAVTQGMFEGQIGGRVESDQGLAQLAVAYIDWGNVKNNAPLYNPAKSFGNSVDSLGNYLYDYNLVDVIFTAKLVTEKVAPGILADFVTNGGGKNDPAYDKTLNSAWLVGVFSKFNRAPVDWDLWYDYRVVQKDAVIGAFNFSDPADGGTNYNGHRVTVGVAVMKNVRLAGTYFHDTKDPDNKESQRHLGYDRFQGDIEVKF